uniref:inositol polyphosphate 5-phosphatase OCRL-like n=1 Tax=Styela clava TaxID=7725 RepID=UPI001939C59D|nr:inositol polyphosphate 5-phosphatase OCRL-like [Styela clava]
MEIVNEFDPLASSNTQDNNAELEMDSNFGNKSDSNGAGILLRNYQTPVKETNTMGTLIDLYDTTGESTNNNNPVQRQISGPTDVRSKIYTNNASVRPARPPPPPPTKKRAVSTNSLIDLDPKFVNLHIKPSNSSRSLKQASTFFIDSPPNPRDTRTPTRPSRSGSSFHTDSSPDVSRLPVTREPQPLNSGSSFFYDNMSSTDASEVTPQKLFGGREQIMQTCMEKRQEEYTIRKPFKIFVGTWNVNGQNPPYEVTDWLSTDDLVRDPPDIYFIGFQELDLSKEAYVFTESWREDNWIVAVSRSLPHVNVKYHMVKSIRLVGMLLLVFVKTMHVLSIRDVTCHQVGTGLLGRMGNKGGVAIRMDLHNSSICAVNSHLAAHLEQCQRRNEDFRDICSRLQFNINGQIMPMSVFQHDVVFWLGDLNYRIQDLSSEYVKELIDERGYKLLKEKDQLNIERGDHRVFQGFNEGEINFRPTYKYNPGTDEWDTSEKCRTPAWCDRVLWRESVLSLRTGANAKPQSSVDLLKYQQHMKLKLSDHKPVSALFQIKVKVIDEGRYKKVFEDENRRLDKLENEYLPTMKLNKQHVDFGEVKFQQPKLETVEIDNGGMRPCNFEFICKNKETNICQKWLTITKPKGCLLPGGKLVLEFEVYVNRLSAPLLNSGEERLDDILILHLEGGKDFFITVTGKYLPSCFGMSIEALCRLQKPVTMVPLEEIRDLSKIQPNRGADFVSSENEVSLSVPKELWTLVDHLYTYGRKQEDLFQQPGLHSEVEDIRDCLDTKVDTTTGRMRLPGSNHSAAEALLILLEAFPEPVIPFHIYQPCLEVCDIFFQCKQVLQGMTRHHRNVFKYICAFLRELLRYSNENGLDVDLVAQIFSGLMLRPSSKVRKPRMEARLDREKAQKFVTHFLVNAYDE